MGKEELYLCVLRKFTENQRDTAGQIKDALEHDEYEIAERLSHTLKGLSGNIGAEALQKKAEALEHGIRSRAEQSELERLLNETGELLAAIIAELDRELPDAAVESDTGRPEGESSPEALLSVLEKLEPFLKANKPKKCAEVLAESRGLVWPQTLRKEAEQLDKLICSYRFKDALTLLEAMQTKLRG